MPHQRFSDRWDRVRELLESRPACIVTAHVRPDGDAVGSELALARLLRQLGCDATVIANDPVPRVYDFLDPAGETHVYEPGRDDPILQAADVLFVLDVSGWQRVGRLGAVMAKLNAQTICIDHHQSNNGFADIDIIVPEAPATGSLIAEALRHLGGRMTRDIAEPLYVAIATDCGWFRFPNTSPETLVECAELAETGLDVSKMYRQIYERNRWQGIRLLARALASLHSEADGRIAWFVLKSEDSAATGADNEDCEGFIDLVRTIEDTELIIFFCELADGSSKVSLRSKYRVDVAELAGRFGGGGHRLAAGISTSEPLDDLIPRVTAAARAALDASAE